jgi:Helicase HerA, central domain
MKFSIGMFQDGDQAAPIDLPRLLETRALVQCNSGGGKSWAIRRLLEVTAGHVQQLVIDPEGEFATLRERFDYVIAAPHDGDALAHPKTAALLARRLMETGVSAVLDIYDLRAHERTSFVRIFCETLVNLPKALWRPALVIVDECHVFCPEVGSAESTSAIVDLATRGRKRGFALVAATQRLSKLRKDCAAELLNKLIGRTGLDVDVKRAADELGMTPREAMERLRPLAPGDFFVFGPALSTTVRPLRVGPVVTTHPKAGDRTLRAPPKPTAAIVAVLPKLSDLPKEAEAEAQSIADLKRELAAARRALTMANTILPSPSVKDLDTARKEGEERGRALAQNAFQDAMREWLRITRQACHSALDEAFQSIEPTRSKPFERATGSEIKREIDRQVRPNPVQAARAGGNGAGHTGDLPRGEAAILAACIMYPDGVERRTLSVLTAYRRSSRDAYIARLREKGLVETDGDRVMATVRRQSAAGCRTAADRAGASGILAGPAAEGGTGHPGSAAAALPESR